MCHIDGTLELEFVPLWHYGTLLVILFLLHSNLIINELRIFYQLGIVGALGSFGL